MSRKTPRVCDGMLHDPTLDRSITLDTPAWQAWLEAEEHRCFHYSHDAGDFTARKERKQRGHWYWVAYRQSHCKLYKIYLGKTAMLNAEHLSSAAETLAYSISTSPADSTD